MINATAIEINLKLLLYIIWVCGQSDGVAMAERWRQEWRSGSKLSVDFNRAGLG